MLQSYWFWRIIALAIFAVTMFAIYKLTYWLNPGWLGAVLIVGGAIAVSHVIDRRERASRARAPRPD